MEPLQGRLAIARGAIRCRQGHTGRALIVPPARVARYSRQQNHQDIRPAANSLRAAVTAEHYTVVPVARLSGVGVAGLIDKALVFNKICQAHLFYDNMTKLLIFL